MPSEAKASPNLTGYLLAGCPAGRPLDAVHIPQDVAPHPLSRQL